MSNGFVPSALAGLALWTVAAMLAGGREPWDTGAFWTVYWPSAIALSFALGMLFPVRAWLWSFVVMAMMMPVMAWNGSGLSLLPLGMVLMAFLAIPGSLAGRAGARLVRRRARL
jgi:hypothetical protein